jgi:hypothetical protein
MKKKKNILFRKINFISKPLEEDKGDADGAIIGSNSPWYIFILEALVGIIFWVMGKKQRKKSHKEILKSGVFNFFVVCLYLFGGIAIFVLFFILMDFLLN